jgi:acyl-CoA dehydrogenase
MRTIASCRKAFDMMCERALSRRTQGEVLAKKQLVQEKIADSYIQLEAFRLLVLQAAWKIDQVGGAKSRREIAVVKVLTPQVLQDIVYRSLHVHGSLGTSNEMPLMGMWTMAPVMGIADGPTEVHKVTIARQVLKEYTPSDGLFPSTHLPPRQEAARKRFADLLEHEVAQH